jgi:hypothetical protein
LILFYDFHPNIKLSQSMPALTPLSTPLAI